MPRVLRRNLPRQLYAHLLERVQQRHISGKDLTLMVEWLDKQPEVPQGKWFKRFPGMTVCGEGELVKTFLAPGQAPLGEEVQ
jgi:hypothetical protein